MGEGTAYPAKLDEELRRLREMGLSVSPELLIRGTRPTESSASLAEPHGKADSLPSAKGYWIGSPGLLGAATEAESVILELRQWAATSPDNADAKAKLLELWIAAEPFLSESELRELRPDILARVFGGDEGRVSLSRNSGDAQGGGR
ncbi:hypothetical protein EDD29_2544 [Actinocorallia herbida]|uniref:Uncharacterized protein n=2 Tax=Actinocorallia herbida TaxID=58109 RepID=A0A3N1CUM7_9ACTN|nr:hypothetical protein EDD29_2544 [Actinocorallia herbida]